MKVIISVGPAQLCNDEQFNTVKYDVDSNKVAIATESILQGLSSRKESGKPVGNAKY